MKNTHFNLEKKGGGEKKRGEERRKRIGEERKWRQRGEALLFSICGFWIVFSGNFFILMFLLVIKILLDLEFRDIIVVTLYET